jgi:hypothetical protein
MPPLVLNLGGVRYRRVRSDELPCLATITEEDEARRTRWERGDASPFAAALVFREALRARLHEAPGTKLLGKGEWGLAFLLPSGRVLKLTRDASEARASNTPALRTGQLVHLVRVFDVFAFPRQELYGIVLERLKPLTTADARQFDWLIRRLDFDLRRTPLATMQATLKREAAANERGRAILAEWQRFQLAAILAELTAARIKFSDFHSGNLMRRGAVYVLIDLGNKAQSGGVAPAVLEAGLTDGMAPSD